MRFHRDFDSVVFAALLKAKITIADFFRITSIICYVKSFKMFQELQHFVLWLLLRLQHIFWKKSHMRNQSGLLCFVQFPSSNNPSPINIWIMIIMCWNLLVLYLCICQVTLIHFLDKSCKEAQWDEKNSEEAFLILFI